ncbi:hydroxyproline-rich glycoprotein family protein [Perilla frutescens var. frutescens]|nr:hydroxyproline-rich glycoprotein family protein [Perilla frutescens var. frutescens]
MADASPKTPKTQIKSSSSQLSSEHENPSKFFLYKAALVTVFLVLVPLFPSWAPDSINQTLHARSWELLQLIFVGIAVSYGLFSKKNGESQKDNHSSKIDNAQSYVSKLLQVSSVFDDESENHTVIEEKKFQTLNSQYYRGEPVVVKENPSLEEEHGIVSHQITQKPLLLPVRSLKQRVPSPNEVDFSNESSGKDSGAGSKRLSSSSSRKSSRNGDVGGLIVDKLEEKADEKVVLRSPIPWRSRSGRLEMKENGDEPTNSFSVPPSMEEQELNRIEFRSFRSSRPNASPKNLSTSSSFSSESQSKVGEDMVIRKKNNFSSPPPAPPPPPSPPFLRKSVLMKSNSSVGNNTEKVLRRSVRSMPTEELSDKEMDDLPRRKNSGAENGVLGKSVRIFRPNEKGEIESKDSVMKFVDRKAKEERKKKEFKKNVLLETTDDDEESEAESEEYDHFEGSPSGNVEAAAAADDNGSDVGPDVDKKADEFIAKFREQIRLQRIESFRRSTAQRTGKSLR